MTEYKVVLDAYNGPLDLLLYLIRREEVDIYDIPIATITEQYLAYVELIRDLDPEAVSEFLVLASTLMEIKSRTLLPRPPVDEGEEDIVDPRLELVRQLLEYKKFKDAARHLDDAAETQAQKHSRSPVLPPEPSDEVDLENIDIWDLFDAFNRMLEQTGKRQAVHRIGIDDTPIALHVEDIIDSIQRAGGTQTFEMIFKGRTRQEMIGLFLALLELIRRRLIRAVQDHSFGPIIIVLLDPSEDEDEIDYIETARETRQVPADAGSTASDSLEHLDAPGAHRDEAAGDAVSPASSAPADAGRASDVITSDQPAAPASGESKNTLGSTEQYAHSFQNMDRSEKTDDTE